MERFKKLCVRHGYTTTDIGRMCFPELPANRAYMAIHRLFNKSPKYVEIRVIKLIAEKLGTPPGVILDMIESGQ